MIEMQTAQRTAIGSTSTVRGLGQNLLLGAALLLCGTSVGCFQSSVNGQTLPSAYYLEDDVQYFMKGPETKLPNQIRALERYKADKEAERGGLPEAPTPLP